MAPEPQISAGSALHGTGACRPCAFFWHPKTCANGEDCEFCHLCPEGEKKAMQKLKNQIMREATKVGLSTNLESQSFEALAPVQKAWPLSLEHLTRPPPGLQSYDVKASSNDSSGSESPLLTLEDSALFLASVAAEAAAAAGRTGGTTDEEAANAASAADKAAAEIAAAAGVDAAAADRAAGIGKKEAAMTFSYAVGQATVCKSPEDIAVATSGSSKPWWSQRIWRLSKDRLGCRQVQALLEHASTSKEERLQISLELHGHVREALRCPNANFVLRKIIHLLPPEELNFCFDELLQKKGPGEVLHAARHKYGCRILTALLKRGPFEQVRVLVNFLLSDVITTCVHPYGNYVIQQLIASSEVDELARLIDSLCPHAAELGHDIFGNAVVAKALVAAPKQAQVKLARAFQQEPKLLQKMAAHDHVSWHGVQAAKLMFKILRSTPAGDCDSPPNVSKVCALSRRGPTEPSNRQKKIIEKREQHKEQKEVAREVEGMLALQHQFIQQQQQQLAFINVQMQQMQQMQANFMMANSLSCAWPLLHATGKAQMSFTKSRMRDSSPS
eukprot:TRINITY_DN12254_c0_g1_i11.p1 TRINITY_DN12254_c0_g1~~TRINITY_DN12254_c0_g1_i11.p1  ORF type:complete len:559 (+),score=129.53 TRINITY_DN12254_c0_g1_i11:78-1754(+)